MKLSIILGRQELFENLLAVVNSAFLIDNSFLRFHISYPADWMKLFCARRRGVQLFLFLFHVKTCFYHVLKETSKLLKFLVNLTFFAFLYNIFLVFLHSYHQ